MRTSTCMAISLQEPISPTPQLWVYGTYHCAVKSMSSGENLSGGNEGGFWEEREREMF